MQRESKRRRTDDSELLCKGVFDSSLFDGYIRINADDAALEQQLPERGAKAAILFTSQTPGLAVLSRLGLRKGI